MKTVSFTNAARKALKSLDQRVAVEIRAKIDGYAAGASADVKRLTGSDLLRLRVRDYRVVFSETADDLVVEVVAHRREVYR